MGHLGSNLKAYILQVPQVLRWFGLKRQSSPLQNAAYSFLAAKAVTPSKPWPIRCKGVFHNRIGKQTNKRKLLGPQQPVNCLAAQADKSADTKLKSAPESGASVFSGASSLPGACHSRAADRVSGSGQCSGTGLSPFSSSRRKRKSLSLLSEEVHFPPLSSPEHASLWRSNPFTMVSRSNIFILELGIPDSNCFND
ncbi:hypothetical protein CEXT_709191 [Caerostris extrusa]|uniref:Uncharacterized protein n=1 Tax=Caerostris extrusa TaxID=172846 RepID=A0AAV4YBW1_CAEEX|nr:hypothetical protein CEXT_709191 [Caerostris extrusa]